jgi:hypothetical protein
MSYMKLIDWARHFGKPTLESAALLLSVVNGLALLRNYLRDKPKLSIEAIHPDVYQWWFPLPGGTHNGLPTRAYGFFVYVDIANRGLRKVQLKDWRLGTRTRFFKTVFLPPLNIPDVEFSIGDHRKFLPILGQKGAFLDGSTVVDPGCSISGTAFYRYECYGGAEWDPLQINGKIPVRFHVTDVFGGQTSLRLRLTPKSLEDLRKFAPEMINSIQKMHQSTNS